MDPFALIVSPGYWAVIEISGTGGIPGKEIYEYLEQLKANVDYKVHPLSLYNEHVVDATITMMGIDAQKISYRVKKSLMISFVERSHLLAFVLKFRDNLLIWRKD